MKHLYLTACMTTCVVLMSGVAQAQDAVPQDPNAPMPEVAPASGEEWIAFSTTDRLAYLIDLKGFTSIGDATAVQIARVATQGPASDLTYRLDEYEIRCAQNQARILVEIEYDSKGTEVERYPEADAEWETLRPTSLGAYFKPIVCEGSRPSGPSSPSIQAFIERGRR